MERTWGTVSLDLASPEGMASRSHGGAGSVPDRYAPLSRSAHTSTASHAQPVPALHSLSGLMQASPQACDASHTRQHSSAGMQVRGSYVDWGWVSSAQPSDRSRLSTLIFMRSALCRER